MHLMFYYSVLLLLDKILVCSYVLITMTNLVHTELDNYVDLQIHSKLSLMIYIIVICAISVEFELAST